MRTIEVSGFTLDADQIVAIGPVRENGKTHEFDVYFKHQAVTCPEAGEWYSQQGREDSVRRSQASRQRVINEWRGHN